MDMRTTDQINCLTETSPLRVVMQRFNSKAELGRILGVTRQAITLMDMDSPLSRVHYLTLRYEKCPDLYQCKNTES